MKKNFLYSMILMLAAMFVTSCEDDSTAGLTRITYYPTLTLEGESFVVAAKGAAYQEPGYSATLQGEDVTDQVEVTSNVDTSKSGLYSVTYTIVNADGFSKSATRKVLVADPNDPVEGAYYSTANSYRISGGKTTVYGKSFLVYILSNGDGTYTINDVLAGYYDQRAGYGSNYAMTADFSVAGDGTISLIDSYVPGWGDGLDSMEGQFDAATSTITWVPVYVGMEFYITLNKKI